jgi:predicted GNAT family N-acyltransferase
MTANLEVTCPTSPIQTAGENSFINAFHNEWRYPNSIITADPPHLDAQLLKDPSRLNEIYQLRVDVWERLANCEFVNRVLYPNGWSDELDKTALHWVITTAQNEIIAAARLNIFSSLDDFPYYSSVKQLSFPAAVPFAFLSRLVVHPDYRQQGLSRKLASSRMLFCQNKNINWFQVFINNKRIIHLFEKMNYQNIGQANVSYHQFSQPHSVNVFIRQNNNYL